MKALVASSLLCVLIITVQAEIGFSLNGTFNPGFTIGSARKREAKVEQEEDPHSEVEWPNPDNINNFPVPESFANAASEDVQDDNPDTSTNEHGQKSKGHHKHHHH